MRSPDASTRAIRAAAQRRAASEVRDDKTPSGPGPACAGGCVVAQHAWTWTSSRTCRARARSASTTPRTRSWLAGSARRRATSSSGAAPVKKARSRRGAEKRNTGWPWRCGGVGHTSRRSRAGQGPHRARGSADRARQRGAGKARSSTARICWAARTSRRQLRGAVREWKKEYERAQKKAHPAQVGASWRQMWGCGGQHRAERRPRYGCGSSREERAKSNGNSYRQLDDLDRCVA